jgi:septum formation topological specificity factor MinE
MKKEILEKILEKYLLSELDNIELKEETDYFV